jgi:outer membrane lipoprotein-sorting protein
VEVWGRHAEDSGAVRLEVLETDKEEVVGMVMVSDGETVWVYSPAKNTVYVGTAEEAKAAMQDKQPMLGEFDIKEMDHPENAEEAVEKLFEYVDVSQRGTETVANADAYQLELKPIPDQMPAEYTAIGGMLNLWIDQRRSVPVALSYTGGAMGEIHITAIELDVNEGVDEALFSFNIPEGAEVIGFADMEHEPLSLDETAASVDFTSLSPQVVPDGAVLADVLNLKGMVVQRYTLADDGSFTIAQGKASEEMKLPSEEQAVTVRGVSGSLFSSEENDKVLLTWSEGELSFVIAGNITAEQALDIAESLK